MDPVPPGAEARRAADGMGQSADLDGPCGGDPADLHRFSETFARGGVGQAGVDANPFHAWIDSWDMRGLDGMNATIDIAPLALSASGTGFQLRAAARRRPSRWCCKATPATAGNRNASRPRIITASRSSRRPAASPSTTSRSRSPGRPGWTGNGAASRWRPTKADGTGSSLHLKSGEKLMLYRMRQTDGSDYCTGNWISPDSTSEQIPPSGIKMTPTAFTRSRGAQIADGVAHRNPRALLAIECNALNPQSWMGHEFSLLGRTDQFHRHPRRRWLSRDDRLLRA